MRTLLFIVLCQFAWLSNAYAQDKQWAMQLSDFSKLSQAKELVQKLHAKGLDAQIYLEDSGHYKVVMPGFKHYQDVLEKRQQLLDYQLLDVQDI
ncbi:MAG: SPOR domain-containing protein, partial [Mariprofundaceae bacterium]|nr:SPOR domain-containing protein [Mariprofundaceae bacterium]